MSKSLSEQAIQIIKEAAENRKDSNGFFDRNKIAELYDTYPHIVGHCLHNNEFEMGTTTARKIIRAHMAHLQAAQRGEMLQRLDANSKYKGTRAF